MDSTVETSTDVNPSQADHNDESAYLLAMQLSRACELPMVLQAAIELGLLEIISKLGNGRPMSALEISASLPSQNPEAPAMIDRLLRLLVTHGILTCSLREQPVGNLSTERVYGPTPVCKFLTQDEDGVSLAPFCLMMQDKVLMESWYYLKDAILEGGVPFDKVFGMSAFEYYRTNSRFTRMLHWGTSSHSAIVMKKIFKKYKGFQGLSTLVDVGGGIGATLCMILSKNPDIKAINLDQCHVIDQAPPHPDIEHVSGDMFLKVPKGDAILLKEICHEWSDMHCLKILRNCYKALPDNGKVIVVECILPEVPDTSPTSKLVIHWDCLMLCYNPCGKERTKDEYEALAKGAGFKGFRIACNAYETYVMEFLKHQQQLGD